MEDELIIDPNDGMACHISYRSGPYPWVVIVMEIDGLSIEKCRFSDLAKAHAYVRKCLPNLELPAGETI